MSLSLMSGDLDLTALTLAELAEVTNAEHRQTLTSAHATLEHAMRAGAALLQAQSMVEPGCWTAWVEENVPLLRHQHKRYMSLAHFRDRLDGSESSISDALDQLASMGLNRNSAWNAKTPSARNEAKRLHSEGLSQREIGQRLGVSQTTVWNWLNDGEYARRKQQAKEQRRLAAKQRKREERDDLARATGGSLAACYSDLRRALSTMDRALGTAHGTQREELLAAIRAAHKAEDLIVRALRLERQGA